MVCNSCKDDTRKDLCTIYLLTSEGRYVGSIDLCSDCLNKFCDTYGIKNNFVENADENDQE